ncbi:MAG: hotdog domain-containing protein [Halioglobus sp.]
MLVPAEPVVRIIATPQDMNTHNIAFGGWVLGLMDQACAVTGLTLSKGAVATAAVQNVTFERPIFCGEVVSVYCREVVPGTSSIKIMVEVIAEQKETGRSAVAARGSFVIVAIDSNGKPRKIEPF